MVLFVGDLEIAGSLFLVLFSGYLRTGGISVGNLQIAIAFVPCIVLLTYYFHQSYNTNYSVEMSRGGAIRLGKLEIDFSGKES